MHVRRKNPDIFTYLPTYLRTYLPTYLPTYLLTYTYRGVGGLLLLLLGGYGKYCNPFAKTSKRKNRIEGLSFSRVAVASSHPWHPGIVAVPHISDGAMSGTAGGGRSRRR